MSVTSVTITEGFGNHSESLLLFLFHGTEFRDVFSSAEGFGTEFRDFLFRGTAGIASEITICSVYSVFRGIFLSEIPNPTSTPPPPQSTSSCQIIEAGRNLTNPPNSVLAVTLYPSPQQPIHIIPPPPTLIWRERQASTLPIQSPKLSHWQSLSLAHKEKTCNKTQRIWRMCGMKLSAIELGTL
jgi:hypothetical protein